jgi:hypothetical protein
MNSGKFPTQFGELNYNIYAEKRLSVRLVGALVVNGVGYNVDGDLQFNDETNSWAFNNGTSLHMKRTDKSDKWSRNAHDKLYNLLPSLWTNFVTPVMLVKADEHAQAKKINRLRAEANELLAQLTAKEEELKTLLANSDQSVKTLADTLMKENNK